MSRARSRDDSWPVRPFGCHAVHATGIQFSAAAADNSPSVRYTYTCPLSLPSPSAVLSLSHSKIERGQKRERIAGGSMDELERCASEERKFIVASPVRSRLQPRD